MEKNRLYKDIAVNETIFRGIVGHGVGDSILECYAVFLDEMSFDQTRKVIFKSNGIKVTFEKDWSNP